LILVCVGGAVYDKIVAVGGVATELHAGAVVPDLGTTSDYAGMPEGSLKTAV